MYIKYSLNNESNLMFEGKDDREKTEIHLALDKPDILQTFEIIDSGEPYKLNYTVTT